MRPDRGESRDHSGRQDRGGGRPNHRPNHEPNRENGGNPRRVLRVPPGLRQALSEFLAVPTLIVLGFLLLAVGTSILDKASPTWLGLIRSAMQRHVFSDSNSTRRLLGTIASSLITVTSITISLVLLAIQQSASSLTFQVIDQFLTRRLNQVTFGFFVGLSLFSLVILSTVNEPYNPVIGASVALVLTPVALYLLLILLYTTVNQMRPSVIIEAIHDHVLQARERQMTIIHQTRRRPRLDGGRRTPVQMWQNGFVVDVDVGAIEKAIESVGDGVEVVLTVPIGRYLAYGDQVAEVRSDTPRRVDEVCKAVQQAVQLGQRRDFSRDPAFGIQQLRDIAWTSISTAKQAVQPGETTIDNLRDILAHWTTRGPEESSGEAARNREDEAG